MKSLLAEALATDDLDLALAPIMEALGIQTGDVAAMVFSGDWHATWPTAHKNQRELKLGQWLAAEVIYANAEDATAAERGAYGRG